MVERACCFVIWTRSGGPRSLKIAERVTVLNEHMQNHYNNTSAETLTERGRTCIYAFAELCLEEFRHILESIGRHDMSLGHAADFRLSQRPLHTHKHCIDHFLMLPCSNTRSQAPHEQVELLLKKQRSAPARVSRVCEISVSDKKTPPSLIL